MNKNNYSMRTRLLRLKGWLFTGLFLCLLSAVNAQVGSYQFAASAGTYTPITGGTVYLTGTFDDGLSANITIPSFSINGVAHTTVKVNANGHIAMTGTYTSTTNYSALSSTTYSTSGTIIAPFGRDCNNSDSGTGEIRYEDLGTEFVVQYSNVRRYNVVGENLNFQVRLEYSTGIVRFVYGSMTFGSNTTYPQIGLKTTSNAWGTNVNSLLLANMPTTTAYSWLDVVAGNANSSTVFMNSTVPIITCASGTTFTFTPQTAVAPVTTFAAVSGITTSGATLSWTAPAGATNYDVEYRQAGTAAWTSAGNTVTNSMTLTGLTDGLVHHYRVLAKNGSTNSRWSHIPTSAAGSGLNGFVAAGSFSTLPGCVAPTALTSANLTNNSVDFSWTAASPVPANGYQYEITTSATNSGTWPNTTTGTTASATGLLPNTTYYLHLRSDCAGLYSSVQTINITTYCDPATLPYSQGFESGFTQAGAVGGCIRQASVTGAGVWSANNTLTDYNRTPRTGAWNAYLQYGNEDWMFFYVSLVGGTSYTTSFYARQDGATATDANMVCSYGAAPNAAAMTNSIITSTNLTNGGYQFFTGNFTPASTGSYWVGIKGFMNSNPWYISIDDITIEATPTCVPSTTLSVSAITNNTATVSWNAAAIVPVNYEWAVTTSATPPASGTVEAGLTASATGLTANTLHYLHVRSFCGGVDYSSWATTSFTTACDPVALPFSENFDALLTGTDIFPSCWTYSNTSSNWTISTAPTANSGANSLRRTWSTDGWAFLPSMTLTGGQSYDVSYFVRTNDATVGYDILVAYGAGQSAGAMTDTINSVLGYQGAAWTQVVYSFTPASTGVYSIGLHVVAPFAPNGVNFDDFSVMETPPCPAPTALAASNITISSADVSASGPINATNGYTIEWGVGNFTGGVGYTSTFPYTITGLLGQTTYQYRIQADCDVDGVSAWSATGTFTTLPCIPTYTTGKTFGDLLSNVEIVGTTLANNSGLAEVNPAYTYFTGLPNYTASLQAGTQYTVNASIGTYGGQGIAAWVDFDDDGLFETSEKIGSTATTTGSGTGNPGDELLPDHTTSFTISLACNPTPGVHRLRVRCAWLQNGPAIDPCANYGYGECEDYDVTITPPPACPIVPTMTFSSVTATTVNATWPVGCAESQWDLAIVTSVGTPGAPTNNDVVLNSNYAITGLTASTTYYVYIQADCIGDGNSSWSGPFSFTTLPPPPANDECASAVGLAVNPGLTCTFDGSGSLSGATASVGPVAACGDFSDDVWFSFVATYSSHIVTISGVTPFTTLSFQVVDACGGAANALNCNNTTATVGGLTPGNTYYVRVASNGATAVSSTFDICVTTPPPPPANDDYCNAATLAVNNSCSSTTGTLVSATLSGVTSGTCYGLTSNFDVWYKFVAPLAVPANTASVIINTQLLTGGVTDGVMQLYSATGTCPGTLTFTEIDCDDDAGPGLLPSITATGLNSGETYYVRMHQYGAASLGADVNNANYGKFGICIVNAGAPVPANDNIAGALLVPGTNSWYPQCYNYSGDCTLSSNSAESTSSTGPDNWMRFVAATTAVSIEMTSTGLNNAITLVQETGPGVYTQLDYENANFSVGGIERMNYDGLVIGTTYYVGVGEATNPTGGSYNMCIRQLLRSGCNTSVAAPLSNCATFKANSTGANTYTYQFSPVGLSIGGGAVSATGAISLSNPALALVPGNTYNVIVNATYNLTDGVGTPESIDVFGSNPSCANVQIAAHSSIEVRASQRCAAPATLLKTSYLRTDPFVCGVTNYTFEFTPVTSCGDNTPTGLAFTYNNNSRIISLNFPGTATTPAGQTIQPQTYYQVRVRPNFSTLGVNPGTYGNPQIIFVGGSVLEMTEELNNMAAEADRMDVESMMDAMVYPNPSNGEVVNLNVANVTSDNVFVRITDATGRMVYSNRYTVEGSLNTIVSFTQPLAAGLYTVEFVMDNEKITERMMIQK